MLNTKRFMFLTLLVLSLLCISTAEKRETPPTADALTQATPVRQLGHHPFWGGGYGYGYGYPFMYPSPFLFRPFFWGWNPYMYAPGPYWRRLEAPCLDPEGCRPAETHTTSITPTTPLAVRQLGHRTRTHTHYYWPVTAQFMYGPYVHYFPHTWHFWGGHHHAHAHMHGRHLGELNDTSTRVNETMPFNSLPFDEDTDAPMSYFDSETGKDMCVFVNATDTTDEKIDDGDTIDVEIVVLPCDEVKRMETARSHNTTEDTETETASPGNNRRLGHRWYGYGGGVYYRPCCVGQYYYPVSMNYVYGVYTPFFPHTYGLWAHTYNRHHGWWRRLQETEAPKETETASPRTPAEMASPNITVPENVTKLIEKYEDLWFEMLTLQEQMSIATETLALSPIEETPFHVSNIQKIVKRMEETARALDKIDREIEQASPIPMHEPIKFVRDNVTYCLFMNVTHPDQDEMETREDSEDRDDMASSETHEQSEDQDQDDVDFAYSLVAMPCDQMKPLNRTKMETPTPEMVSPVETETVSPPTTPTTTTPVSPESAVPVGGGGRRMLRKKIGKKKGGN